MYDSREWETREWWKKIGGKKREGVKFSTPHDYKTG